jgi:alpha-amylase
VLWLLNIYGGFSFGFLLYVFKSYSFIPFKSVIFSYSPKYVKEYIQGAKPLFSVGEYWDTCNYKGSSLDYNQGIVLK